MPLPYQSPRQYHTKTIPIPSQHHANVIPIPYQNHSNTIPAPYQYHNNTKTILVITDLLRMDITLAMQLRRIQFRRKYSADIMESQCNCSRPIMRLLPIAAQFIPILLILRQYNTYTILILLILTKYCANTITMLC